MGAYGTDRVSKTVLAAAVPPYLYKTDSNPDGALDDAAIEAFQAGVRNDRVAFVDGFVTNLFSVRGRTDLISDRPAFLQPRHRGVRLPEGNARLHRCLLSDRLP